jgi:hypothetical protein
MKVPELYERVPELNASTGRDFGMCLFGYCDSRLEIGDCPHIVASGCTEHAASWMCANGSDCIGMFSKRMLILKLVSVLGFF